MSPSLEEFTDRRQLLDEVQRKFETRLERVHIGDCEFEILRVADPDSVLDDVVGDDAMYQPYWAEAWHSAEVLSHWLLDRDLVGTRVLEIGCGLGVVGTVVASRGAKVIMSDAVPPSLLFARFNSWEFRSSAQVRQLDWRKDSIDERFPLILGSDIAYDREEWKYLDDFWNSHLEDGGEVILSEPGRKVGGEFIRWLDDSVWHCECHLLGSSAIGDRMRILKLRRR